jgi:enterochelin esterase-like enzyme
MLPSMALRPPTILTRALPGPSTRRATVAFALVVTLTLASVLLLRSSPPHRSARRFAARWTLLERGARGGATWSVPSGAIGAVYLPRGASPTRRVSAVYLVPSGASPAFVRPLGLARMGDQLISQGSTVPFAVVVVRGTSVRALAAAVRLARVSLPMRRGRTGSMAVTIGVSPLLTRRIHVQLGPSFGRIEAIAVLRPRALFDALGAALAPPGATRASAAANGVLPRSFSRISVGPAGGTIWQGVIPGAPGGTRPRASLIYLPPAIDRRRRYPVIYLLHGIRGAPYSFPGGLGLTAVADHLIAERRVRPFIGVMPPAGADAAYRGEWTGVWELYVVRSVVPYADRTLPTIPEARGRAIAGLSAGGYGAIDIALRHPGMFGTVEAWSGYFKAPHDGSLAHASARTLAAHDPSRLVRRQAPTLRASAIRFFLMTGAHDRESRAQTRRYAGELTRLGLRPTLRITPGGHTTRSWRAALPDALRFAVGRS